MKQKTFNLHWGKGIVAEEAQAIGEYHIPTIQLLEYNEGEAKGQSHIRFSHYSHDGVFQRSPLIIDESNISELKLAIRDCPKLHRLLKRLI